MPPIYQKGDYKMSKIRPDHADSKKIFDGFEGLCAVKPPSEGGLSVISNFRVREDGVLEKRCGYRIHAAFPSPVRGFWQGTVGGYARCFAVSGNTVFHLTNGTATDSSTIDSTDGAVYFFTYSDRLFLIDGISIYAFDELYLQFRKTVGYAPLYGRNWHPTNYGDVYEELNLLCPRLRVHYANTTGATEFHLPYYAASVDKVRIDNRTVTGYYLNAAGDVLTVPSVGSSIEVAFTMATDDAERELVPQCTRAFTDRIDARERLILYGAPLGHYLFCASAVPNVMVNACKVFYSDATPLYFKSDGIILVGAPDAPVTTLYRNHDRVLAFHAMGASSITFDPDGDGATDYPLLRGVGCCVNGVELSPEGDPIVLNEQGILQLSSTASEPDTFVLKDLSAGLKEVRALCKKPNTIVCHDAAHGELWLRDPDDTQGLVWVLRLSGRQWYCFEAINATLFCEIDGSRGFADNYGYLFVFDDDLLTDAGSPIKGTIETDFLSLSDPELQKRSLRVSVCTQGRGLTQLVLETERKSKSQTFSEETSQNPSLIDMRASLGRFRFVRVRISDSGSCRSKYHRLALYANL